MTLPGHGRSGYEAKTRDPERRAFFDLAKRISEIEGIAGGNPWDFMGTIPTTGPPTDAQDAPPHEDGDMWIDADGDGWVWNGNEWVNVGPIQGPPGPPGPPGISGVGFEEVWIGPTDPIIANPTVELWYDTDELGAPGGGGGGPVSYVHVQGIAAASWIITHALGRFPNVTVVDSSGANCEGQVGYIDESALTIQFSAAFTGTAYLS